MRGNLLLSSHVDMAVKFFMVWKYVPPSNIFSIIRTLQNDLGAASRCNYWGTGVGHTKATWCSVSWQCVAISLPTIRQLLCHRLFPEKSTLVVNINVGNVIRGEDSRTERIRDIARDKRGQLLLPGRRLIWQSGLTLACVPWMPSKP